MYRNERLKRAFEYLKSKGVVHTQKDLAEKMGTTPPNVSSALKGVEDVLTDNFIRRFNNAFDNIFNIDWLLIGSGNMFNDNMHGNVSNILNGSSSDSQNPVKSYSTGVPYYNVDFIGGFDLIINDQTINPEYYIQFKPYDKATCWCNITGHSMEPEINHGDIIALREITDISFLPYGEIYAIVTTNDMRTVKRIGPSANPDNYTLIPTNKSPEYGIQELPKNKILRIFEVMGCMKKF